MCDCTEPHPPGHVFFVSVHDGRRTGFLLGPYDTHGEAIANVERSKRLAQGADPKADTYTYGTCSLGPEYANKVKPVFDSTKEG